MLYPILPIFLTQVLHSSRSVVGVVEGIAEATQNVVQGFSGWLSDRLQKRKALALIGYFVSALGKPLITVRSLLLRVASDCCLFQANGTTPPFKLKVCAATC
jgi:MFS family permease